MKRSFRFHINNWENASLQQSQVVKNNIVDSVEYLLEEEIGKKKKWWVNMFFFEQRENEKNVTHISSFCT